MGRISIPAILLALGVSVLGFGTASAELVPGGWLMPPRIPEAVPLRPPPPKAAGAAARQPPPPRTRPAKQTPPPRTAPSDGNVRF